MSLVIICGAEGFVSATTLATVVLVTISGSTLVVGALSKSSFLTHETVLTITAKRAKAVNVLIAFIIVF